MNVLPIITLTTDFGKKDPSAGTLKAAIYSHLPQVEIVDISHSVNPFHILEAAYIIKNAYQTFPPGTIHILGIDSECTTLNKHLIVQIDGHFFICADNGILSLIAAEINPEKIIQVNKENIPKTPFPEMIFSAIAIHLLKGFEPEKIGKAIPEMKGLKETKPLLNTEKNEILGQVMYSDHYGNVVTNIKKQLFEESRRGRDFLITARAAKFREIFNTYSDGIDFLIEKEAREEDGKRMAIFNSAGYIELAVYKSNHSTVGSASALFGLQLGDGINIHFY